MSGNRLLQQYLGLHRWALVMVCSLLQVNSLIAKSKKRRNGQRDWCMSRVTAIISALVICIIVCLSWAVNHYRDNAITYKAQRDKNARELKLANAAITDGCADASAWCCCARCKIHEELADKAEMMPCAWCCRWSSSVALSKQSVSQCVKLPSPPAWIMQPPPDWQTPLNGIISPSERADHYAKTTGRNPEVY